MYEDGGYQCPYPALLHVLKTEDQVAFNAGRICSVECIKSQSDTDQDQNISGPHD